MKNQFTIFLFVLFAISSFGQNKVNSNASSETIRKLPSKKVKGVACIDDCIVRIPKANGYSKRRYIVLKERHSNKYPNRRNCTSFTGQIQKTPELEPSLKEIRF